MVGQRASFFPIGPTVPNRSVNERIASDAALMCRMRKR